MNATCDRVRHGISRQTGATTWTRKVEDRWVTTCLNHDAETSADARGPGVEEGLDPGNWCPKCKVIAAGKPDRITGDRLDLPKTPAEKATAKAAAPQGNQGHCEQEGRAQAQGRAGR